jgi:uncharacterized protein (DUF302 family)
VSEKELLLNYTSDEVIDTITAAVTSKGFKIIVRDVSEVISL